MICFKLNGIATTIITKPIIFASVFGKEIRYGQSQPRPTLTMVTAQSHHRYTEVVIFSLNQFVLNQFKSFNSILRFIVDFCRLRTKSFRNNQFELLRELALLNWVGSQRSIIVIRISDDIFD